jgi:hypothetical protein
MEEKYDPEVIRLKSLIRGARIASIVAIVCYMLIIIPFALAMLGFGDGRNPAWPYPVLSLYLVSLIIGFKWQGPGGFIGLVPCLILLYVYIDNIEWIPIMVFPMLVLWVPVIWNLTVWNMKREMQKNLQDSL